MSHLLKLAALLASAAAALYGQYASLSGFVSDASNAVVPKAAVEIRSVDTGFKYTTRSNETGVYFFGSLKPGKYDITVQAAGFRTDIVRGLKLDVAQEATLDFTLKLGETRQSVTVSAEAGALVQTVDASVSTVISREFVQDMPLNGRSFNTLVELTPGTVDVATSETSRGTFAINGQRADANYYTVDGVSANIGGASSKGFGQGGTGSVAAASALGGTNNLVSIDALQEFRIMTSTYAPEYGRTAGGQIAIITRSGTNQFHGAVFEYFRNDKLDANNWFSNRSALGKAPSRQNDFGGVLGGPVRKDHTFFFLSYEGLRLAQPRTVITDVPSLALRKQAPANEQPFINAFPLPTGPDGIDPKTGKPTGLAPAISSASSLSRLDAGSLKIDHMVKDKVQLFGRFDLAPSYSDSRATNATQNGALNAIWAFDAPLFTTTVGAIAILSPTMTNDFRANYSQAGGNRHYWVDNFGGATVPLDSAIFPPGYGSANALVTFRIITGAATSIEVGALGHMVQQQYNMVDYFSMVKGVHTLKFGGDYRRLITKAKNNQFQATISYSDTGFLNNAATGTVMSGVTSSDTLSISRPGQALFNQGSLFAQDTWKAARRLTLTYGLRWELDPPPVSGTSVKLFAFDQVSDPSTAGLAPSGTPVFRTRYRNFEPRVGLAYQLSQDPKWMTVMRTGFGLFHSPEYSLLSQAFAFQPFVYTVSLPNTAYPLPPGVGVPVFASGPPLNNFNGVDPNLQIARVWQWNFSVQQSLGSSRSVSASYIGAAGRELVDGEQYLNLNSSFTGLTTIGMNSCTSDYESLQVQYTHLFFRGLRAMAWYVWSHSIDTASSDVTSVIHPANYYPEINRGNSDFDVRHNFSVSAVYLMPTPRFGGRMGRAILGGWGIDPMIRVRSASPIDITTTRSVSGQNITSRVNSIPHQAIYLKDPTVPGGWRLNAAAFAAAAGFAQGNLGRNVVHGFPFHQVDFALHRNLTVIEHLRMQLRGDFFNVLNHPNFGPPSGALSTPSTFGVSTAMLNSSLNSATGGGFNALYQIGGPRSIQLSLRLSF